MLNDIISYAALTVVDLQGTRAVSEKSDVWTGSVSRVTWILSVYNSLTPKLPGMPGLSTNMELAIIPANSITQTQA